MISRYLIIIAFNSIYLTDAMKTNLEFQGPNITKINSAMLQPYKYTLQDLSLIDLPNLEEIEEDSFKNLTALRSLYIWNAPKLTHLPKNLLDHDPSKMKSLRIVYSGLMEPPRMDALTDSGQVLHIVDLEGNHIHVLATRSIRVRTDQLILDDNDLREIQDYAFDGSELAELSLKRNKNLVNLNDLSFAGILGIRELDVSSTSILRLPTLGLEKLEVLMVQDNVHMKTIPSIYDFKNLRQAWLTHHFHCCAFRFPELHDPDKHNQFLEYKDKLKQVRGEIVFNDTYTENQIVTTKMKRDIWQIQNGSISESLLPWSSETIVKTGDEWAGESEQYYSEDQKWNDEDFGVFHQKEASIAANYQIAICGNLTEGLLAVQCWPKSDALNPCSGVLGSTTAHVFGWIVGVIGSTANLLVILVLMARTSSCPARLIQLQLALADFCTAGYLLLLASVDSYTSGSYFNFAYDWQYGAGCQIAGFLGVAGAQGSLLALAALTLERWLAITQALYPNRRLSPRAAKIFLCAAVIYSFLIAALPFAGLSDYSSTSVCLPMRQKSIGDSVYLWTLLTGGVLSVFTVAACYIHIYVTLARDSRQCTSKNVEASVAHKMAVLIITHMACVVPIGGVAAGALSGWPLVDVRGAKFLLVLVYPLNALADPFLYAILTHYFRKDLCLLLARFGLCTRTAQQFKVPGAQRAQLLHTKNNDGECENRRGELACVVPLRSTTRSLTTAYEELPV